MKLSKKPWPTKAAMEQIYRDKLWGDDGSNFYSGEGSHHPSLVEPYVKTVTSFLKSFEQPISVCDLGCGDFNVGKQLVSHTKKYAGVDIVAELIAFNTGQFAYPNLEFQCLDIAKDDLPKADCAILRQVLQHLSNTEVAEVVKKLYGYKYLILTEHLPEGEYVPNKDIISGQGIRLKKQSGLDLLQAPFHLKTREAKQLLTQDAMIFEGQLITTLYRMF
jgi:hypothetical protein